MFFDGCLVTIQSVLSCRCVTVKALQGNDYKLLLLIIKKGSNRSSFLLLLWLVCFQPSQQSAAGSPLVMLMYFCTDMI